MVAQEVTVDSNVLETLQTYIDRGWNIFPVEANGKRPVVVSTGKDDQGEKYEIRFKWKDLETNRVTKPQVERWFQMYPNCNWGVICGKVSDIVVVDVDGSEGAESLKKYHPEMENTKTLVQKSPRGFHLIFKHTGNPVKSFPILPKVDIKGDGGYIVIAPSKTLDGTYKIVMDEKPATCPGWVARGERAGFEGEAPDVPVGRDAQPMWVSELLETGSPSGRRNSDAAKLVGYFWNRHISSDIILKIIAPWAERCQPPMDIKEQKTVVKSICSYQQMAKSRGVMDPPVMTSTGVGWKFSWHNIGIDIDVSRLSDTDRYGLVGEIEVHTSIPAFPKYLYGPSDYAFKDGRLQAQLIQELEKRMHGPAWPQLLTDMSRLVIGQFSKGSEWQLLRDASRSVSFGYAYRPILLANEPTLWFSAGGGLKSYLALVLGVMMETGLDVGIGPALVRNHVAYLDWEWDVGQHAKRLDSIISAEQQEALGVNIVYRHCGGRSLRKQLDQIKRMIAEEGITFVIIDSASPACGRASDNDEIVAFFQAISELRVGALVLAHVTKNDRKDEDGATMAYGGVQWENQSRSAWNLRKNQEEGSSSADLVLAHQKVNGGPLSVPITVRFNFPDEFDNDQRITLQRLDNGGSPIPSHPARDRSPKLWGRIKEALRSRPQTIAQLCAAIPDIGALDLESILVSMDNKGVTRAVRQSNGEMIEFWGLRTVANG